MKRKIWLFGFLGIGSVVTLLSTIGFNNSTRATFSKPNKSTFFNIEVKGAIERPGIYKYDKPIELRVFLNFVRPLIEADLSKIDLDRQIANSLKIYIPYKKCSISWTSLNNINQLVNLGIRKNIALKILKFRKENDKTTWKQLSDLKGVGITTIKILKKYLVL
ncbi:MAG0490 family ComEA-like DNA-binding protein [Mycoplasma sp. Mirounga ES2805-ORL]|uniref:MAG0490 family ComEA-like DNA-binding protein n=1 Tax=Mycoplasma sp. Mirounga ES2805-ORL TaxID=754514 RepID=UPI00197B10A3|nr:hypothetical protein [Mycoplasma sp. Mirounga ES2805-ORL]QSF13665.1 hypothetical protein JXZ90_03290 [Mycoplasma sp. Mirounga ES2805-ORL]